MFFFCSAAFIVNTWAFWSGARDLQCLCCAAVLFFTKRSLSSGERDSHFFCVHQHWLLKFWPFSREEETLVVSCVHQYHCIKFEIFFWWERLPIVLLSSDMFDQNLCFPIWRERLSISFYSCRVCLQILSEETFSMLFNLSRCSSAENFCNLHAITAILFIFLHKYLVFLLRPSSFVYIVSLYIIPWFKKKRCCQARLHSSNKGWWFFEWGVFLPRAHRYQNQYGKWA